MLAVANRESQSVSLVDLATGREIAQVATLLRFPAAFALSLNDVYAGVTWASEVFRIAVWRAPAAVAVSPDNRYAFVTVAGLGGDPGTVDVIDLASRFDRCHGRGGARGGQRRFLEDRTKTSLH